MVDVSGAISQMVILLLVAAVGFIATKLGYLDQHVKDKVTLLLLNVTLPSMIIASAGALDSSSVGGQVAMIFVLGVVQFFLLLASGFFCNIILRTPHEQRRMYLFMSVCTNTGFIGIPVVAAIYGSYTVLFSSVLIMALNLFIFSIGFALIAPPSTETGADRILHVLKSTISPATIASLIALILVFSGLSLPHIFQGTLETVGSITAPLAMMLVGMIIANVRLSTVVKEWRLYPYIVIRQLLVPALTFIVLRCFIEDPLILGIFTVMFAMPVGSMTSMFAARFNRDQALPAKATILSTLGSFIIIPLLVAFMALA